MTGAEGDGFPIAGSCDILNVVTTQASILEYCVIAFLGEFKRVALANPVCAPRQPFYLIAFKPE